MNGSDEISDLSQGSTALKVSVSGPAAHSASVRTRHTKQPSRMPDTANMPRCDVTIVGHFCVPSSRE